MLARTTTVIVTTSLFFIWGYSTSNAQEVKNSSWTTKAGERILRHEVIVNATLEEVWDAWTTSEGLKTWMAPVVYVDLGVSGKWESSYNLDARIGDAGNIHNEIISYLPMEMISIKIVSVPTGFPFDVEKAKSLWTVIQLQDLGNKQVKVTITMLGYKKGEEYDDLHTMFDEGNSYTLAELYRRFEEGPRKWK